MAMTPIPEFPALSDRAAGTYNSKAFAWASHMGNTFVPELDAAVGSMSAFAAGGAYAFQYVFDSATTDADPGVGKLRLGSATQNTSTVLRIDNAMTGGADLSTIFAGLLAVTSSTKGSIRLVKVSDPTKWMILDVTGGASPSGYRNLTASVRIASTTNPFANGDALMVYIDYRGDLASSSMVKLAEATIVSPVALIDFLTVFTADCDKVIIETQGLTTATNGQALDLRFAIGGVAQTGSSYLGFATAGSAMTGATQLRISTVSLGTSTANAFTFEVRNINGTNAKPVSVRGAVASGSGGVSAEGYASLVSALSGFRLSLASGENFTGGTVRVYGIRN